MLRELREKNIDAFENIIKVCCLNFGSLVIKVYARLLQELKIAYTVPKRPDHVKTRKAWSEAQLRLRVEAEKEKRLEELHKR